MHQLVRLAREEELLDPVPSPRLDAVAEEPHEPHELDEPHHDVGELLWDEVVQFCFDLCVVSCFGFCGYMRVLVPVLVLEHAPLRLEEFHRTRARSSSNTGVLHAVTLPSWADRFPGVGQRNLLHGLPQAPNRVFLQICRGNQQFRAPCQLKLRSISLMLLE